MRRRRHAGRRSAMAIDIKEPAVKAPWPPKEENDPLYRYPKPLSGGSSQGRELLHDREEAPPGRERPGQLQLPDQELLGDQLVPGELRRLPDSEARPALLRARRRELRPPEEHGRHLHSDARRDD